MIARIMILAPVIGCVVGWLVLRIPDEESAGSLISLSITGNIWGGYLVFQAIRDNMRRMEGRKAPARVDRPHAHMPLVRDSKLRAHERIGDEERDQVVRELGLHYQAGRLDVEEFDVRSSAAIKSKTYGELKEILWNLPLIRDDGRRLDV